MFSIKALKPSFRSRSELEQVWKKATRLRFRNGRSDVRFLKSLQSDQNSHFLLLFWRELRFVKRWIAAVSLGSDINTVCL